jgi:hypothetical protein
MVKMTDDKKNMIDVPPNSNLVKHERERGLSETEQTGMLRKHERKQNWISEIMLKQIQGKKLSDEDWSFYMNMFVNAKDEEIEQLAKASIVELQKISSDTKDSIDPESYWQLKQRDTHLIQNLMKTIKQGRKADSDTRKNDVRTFNAMVREAKKKGGFYSDRETVPVSEAPDCVDNTVQAKKKKRGKK